MRFLNSSSASTAVFLCFNCLAVLVIIAPTVVRTIIKQEKVDLSELIIFYVSFVTFSAMYWTAYLVIFDNDDSNAVILSLLLVFVLCFVDFIGHHQSDQDIINSFKHLEGTSFSVFHIILDIACLALAGYYGLQNALAPDLSIVFCLSVVFFILLYLFDLQNQVKKTIAYLKVKTLPPADDIKFV